jgi:hypothetical protein
VQADHGDDDEGSHDDHEDDVRDEHTATCACGCRSLDSAYGLGTSTSMLSTQ